MKIAFEGVLFLLLVLVGLFAVGIPLVKIFKMVFPSKRDTLREAQERLEVARKDEEAARLNKEAEKVYSRIYEEVLEDDNEEERFKRKLNE